MEPHHSEEDLLFKGKNIHCRKNPLFEGLGDSLVYSGYFKKANDPKEEIVVRKIKVTDCCDKWKDIFDKHTREKDPIKHENVLRTIGYEGTDEWRFFALEPYDATLEQFCKEIYKGPMPSDAQVLCQIANGLLYLHGEQCSHGNLTPRTILIASSQPVRMMIKLSEFGLSKSGDQWDEGKKGREIRKGKKGKKKGRNKGENKQREDQELCQRKYWILDGTTENNQTPTIDYNQDIFSAGCLCFYFLTRGVHPFGDDSSSILENIKKRNPVNLLPTIQQGKDIWEFAYEPIKNMIGNPQNPTLWLLIAKTCFMKALPLRFEVKKENELGRGTFGVVYRGTYEGNAIAVKVTVKVDLDDARKKEQKREMEEHLRLHHENVLKLLHVDDSRDKTLCLVLELCAGTLKDYCEDKYKGPELPPDGIVLYQMASGLHYIHSRNLVHRDVKPANILISMTTPVQMKLSDFGFVKKTSHRGTFTQSGLKGTLNWMAPEILKLVDETITELPHGTIQSDTFAAGCVFFYFLARGKHPFGKSIQIGGNILKNKPIELNKHNENLQGEDRVLYELIGKMIKLKEERISLPEVIEQLTAKLYASRQFKEFEMVISEWSRCVTRFHPTEPVLACSVDDKVIFLTADNSSIPFSNWKEMKTQLQPDGIFLKFYAIEWIAGGTQLAAIGHRAIVNADDSVITENVIVCWSYPSGEILFQEKLNDEKMNQIEWNPFRLNVFATFHMESFSIGKKVFFFNSCPVDQRPFHFCTIEHDITSFQWISENRVALGITKDGGIEILEIDESTTSVKIVKRIKHESVTCPILIMAWDERTKCLAACSDDGWMAIWSMDSDQPIHKTKVDGHCWSLAWRPNGKQTDDAGVDAARKSADNFILACGLDNGQIVIWTPLAEEKIRILRQHSRWVHSLSFSPDGRFLASADENGKLIIWSAENWQPVYIGQEGIIRYKSFSWMSPSTDVSDYKLTFDSYSDKVRVVEYAVGQNEKSSEDGSPPGKWSIGPSVDLK